MFTRLKRQELQNALLRSPAVVLLGPRQVGKTTLALDVALPDGGYLDLESPEDRNKLSNFEQWACPRFCVNGLMAGNCQSSQRKRNDRKQRTDRPPVGGLQKT